jgi:hypothetical protein
MALLLALFALILLSAIGLCMVLASDTETRIDGNYSSSLRAYYAARSGVEEVKDRINLPATSPASLANQLPQDIAGNANSVTGVLYVLNPAGGEVVDPTDPASPYYDDQLCHDYNSGVSAKDAKCTVQPSTANWNATQLAAALADAATPLGYKWVRINIKTNRIAGPYFVDQIGDPATLDTRVCWNGQAEQLTPSTTNPACDANGMQTVYVLTSLAATPQIGGPNGARKLLRAEVVSPSIRPPGAITMGVDPASTSLPVLGGDTIPSIAVDGRPHRLDGTLATSGSCSAIAPLAADSSTGSTQLEQALNLVRKNIVTKANTSCYADGTPSTSCTPGLWWVRGTDQYPRFATPGSGSGSGGRNEDDDGHDGHDHHRDPTGLSDVACDPTNPACYTNLDLAAPELLATSASFAVHVPVVTLPADGTAPFTGGLGNQADASVYQPGSASIVSNGIAAINSLVTDNIDQPYYYTASSTSLAASYGDSKHPAIVVFTDPTLSLQNNAVGLSGFGILVIPNALEISNATLNWTGIVIVNSPTGHVMINSGATGFINGVLMLQPGAALAMQNNIGSFRLTYSCEAIDLPFASKPFKIVATSESSF